MIKAKHVLLLCWFVRFCAGKTALALKRSCNFSRAKIERINTVARHVLLQNHAIFWTNWWIIVNWTARNKSKYKHFIPRKMLLKILSVFALEKLHSRWSTRAFFPSENRTNQHSSKTCFTTEPCHFLNQLMDHCELDRSEQIEIQAFYSKKNAFENTVCFCAGKTALALKRSCNFSRAKIERINTVARLVLLQNHAIFWTNWWIIVNWTTRNKSKYKHLIPRKMLLKILSVKLRPFCRGL